MPGFTPDFDHRHWGFRRNTTNFSPDKFIQHQIAEYDDSTFSEALDDFPCALLVHSAVSLSIVIEACNVKCNEIPRNRRSLSQCGDLAIRLANWSNDFSRSCN